MMSMAHFIFLLSLMATISLFVLSGYGLAKDEPHKVAFTLMLGLIALLFSLVQGAEIKQSSWVPAIEVYRGNTVLQVTYRDSVAVDSIVVYKDK